MQLCKTQLETGEFRVGILEDDHVRFLDLSGVIGTKTLSDILHADNPAQLARDLNYDEASSLALRDLTMLAPIDQQEIWAAGVTYKRSQEARERESEGAGSFYDKVYSADRPELFFKSLPHRVSGPGQRVHIRRDSQWSVPEPELGLVLSPKMTLVGYTIGNDMSARDIEGENPLYLPQAKMYEKSCAIGPVITLAEAIPDPSRIKIRLRIEREAETVFDGSTSIAEMKRTFDDLVSWLGRETRFPNGVILLTGTGIVPPDEFSLQPGDRIHIEATGIGRLTNRVGVFESSLI